MDQKKDHEIDVAAAVAEGKKLLEELKETAARIEESINKNKHLINK